MKILLIFLSTMILSGCSSMMSLFTSDDMKNATSISVAVDKEAFEKNSNVHVVVDVINMHEVK